MAKRKLYLLYVRGVGEGCDYTIGCNLAVHRISSRSWDDALDQAAEKLADYGDAKDVSQHVQKAVLYEIAQAADIDPVDLTRQVRERRKARKREEDMTKLRELAAKYGVKLEEPS